jgi:hypothetical protein
MKKQEQLLSGEQQDMQLLSASELQKVDGGRLLPDPPPHIPLISICKFFPAVCLLPKQGGARSSGGGVGGNW